MSVIWEDPPSRPKPGPKWGNEAGELRTRPGRWARIGELATKEKARNTASAIRVGHLRAFTPPGAYDACCLDRRVWAVYRGDGNLPPEKR